MRDTLNLLTSTQTTKEKITGCAVQIQMEAGAGMEGKSRRKLDFEDCLR